MKKYTPLMIAILFVAASIITACTPAQSQTEESPDPVQVTVLPTAEPTPVPPPTNTPMPPIEESPSDPQALPPVNNDFAPQPGDEDLNRGNAFVEGASVTNVKNANGEILVSISLGGSLPTPCNQLRIEVGSLTENNEIHLTVYSLTNPDEACITVIEEFSAAIEIGPYPEDSYKIYSNDILIGETGNSSDDDEGGESMIRGPITIEQQGVDYDESRMPSAQVQLLGFLPTPCHEFRADVMAPNENNEIHLDVYTMVDPSQMCLTVLEGFEATVDLEEYGSGVYTVLVNDIEVGGFEIP